MRLDFLPRSLCLAALLLLGCQIEDIVVEVMEGNGTVELMIHEKDSQDPVDVILVQVTDSYSGTVWQIATFDRSENYEVREGKQVLRTTADLPGVKSVPISRVMLGNLPEGFRQVIPLDQQIPRFEEGHEYEVFVTGGAHRGRAKFLYRPTVDTNNPDSPHAN